MVFLSPSRVTSKGSKVSLDVAVVGAGICGLSVAICLAQKGHSVKVLESSPALSEVGAGIQVSSNASRILAAWGLLPTLHKVASHVASVRVNRYDNGEVLLPANQGVDMEQTYGFPLFHFYRPDLQRVLAEHLGSEGVEPQFGSRVARLDCEDGRLWLEDGSSITVDLIVCADGIRSTTRRFVLGDAEVSPRLFRDLVYRAVVPASTMLSDPDTAALLASGTGDMWFGPGRAIITYPVAQGALFNVAAIAPRWNGALVHRWTEAGDVAEFRAMMNDFCPIVQKILSHVQTCTIWTLAEIPSLSSWSRGKAILVGDAAHAMSPAVGQGAGMSIEDAGVLGECLDYLSSLDDLPIALRKFEKVRRARAERVTELGRLHASSSTLPDGEEQEARDRRFRVASNELGSPKMAACENGIDVESRPMPDKSQQWGEPGLMMWLLGFDAIEDAKTNCAG